MWEGNSKGWVKDCSWSVWDNVGKSSDLGGGLLSQSEEISAILLPTVMS